MTEIISCKCHICKDDFALELDKGGMCDNCMEPTCHKHLKVKKDGPASQYMCEKCDNENAGKS